MLREHAANDVLVNLDTEDLAELLGDACVISLLSPDERTLRPVAIFDVDAQRLDALRASAPERPLSSPDSLRRSGATFTRSA